MRDLVAFIPADAWVEDKAWLGLSYYLWNNLVPLSRDFFLPKLYADFDGFWAVLASVSDLAFYNAAVLPRLEVPPSLARALGSTRRPLLGTILSTAWTGHSRGAPGSGGEVL